MEPPLPWQTPDNLSLDGAIKTEPEDFQVEEIPAYDPTGEGEHLFLWVQKRDVSAEHLVAHLARTLQVRRDDIGVAGMKDRRAVTRQWISVPATAESRVPEAETDQIQVLQSARHANKLRTGHLRGNRFEILIRTTTPDACAISQELVDLISRQGCPNFFGEQRFGYDGQTLALGRALLTGEASAKQIPFKRRKFLLRLALSAAQSSLFNAVLRQRMADGLLHQVLVGDVMQLAPARGMFIVNDAAIEQERFDRHETVTTGPLFGPKMKKPEHSVWEREEQVLTEAGLTLETFARNKKLTPGGRRPLLQRPQDLLAEHDPSGVRLRFTLPSGVYATVLLREFLKHQPGAGESAPEESLSTEDDSASEANAE